MADVQFDIALKNTGSATEGLTLFAPVDSASQKSNKYSFATPYTPNYPKNTIFTILDSAGSNQITLDAQHTMAEVCILLSGLNAGTFIVGFNDVTNGNVFYLLTQRTPVSFSIDNNDYFGSFALIDTATLWTYSPISFVNASIILIAETNAAIQRSIDGGNTFSPASFPAAAGYEIYGLSFIDALNGFACGYNGATAGRIWKTIDGGANWTNVSTTANSKFWGIWMFDALNGITYREVTAIFEIAITANGGLTWTQVQIIGNGAGAIQFVDSLNGFIFEGFAELLSTNNGGASWSAKVAPFTIFAGFALDANNLWIGGASGAVRYSNNGGNSFISKNIPTAFNVVSIQAFTTDHIIAGLTGRRYAYTADGGSNWTIVTIAAGGTQFMLKFLDQYVGIAHDSQTNIYKYS
jgi:photosystem II stability/assembly factor-like uncharacterized protein